MLLPKRGYRMGDLKWEEWRVHQHRAFMHRRILSLLPWVIQRKIGQTVVTAFPTEIASMGILNAWLVLESMPYPPWRKHPLMWHVTAVSTPPLGAWAWGMLAQRRGRKYSKYSTFGDFLAASKSLVGYVKLSHLLSRQIHTNRFATPMCRVGRIMPRAQALTTNHTPDP